MSRGGLTVGDSVNIPLWWGWRGLRPLQSSCGLASADPDTQMPKPPPAQWRSAASRVVGSGDAHSRCLGRARRVVAGQGQRPSPWISANGQARNEAANRANRLSDRNPRSENVIPGGPRPGCATAYRTRDPCCDPELALEQSTVWAIVGATFFGEQPRKRQQAPIFTTFFCHRMLHGPLTRKLYTERGFSMSSKKTACRDLNRQLNRAS